jgi:uncharacterized membrane protein
MTKRSLVVIAAFLVVWMTAGVRAAAQEPVDPSRARGILDVLVVNENNKPLPGVTVAVPGFRSKTGLAGTCRYSLVPGRYSVLIQKGGYRGRRINAGVRPGETTNLRVQLDKLAIPRQAEKK